MNHRIDVSLINGSVHVDPNPLHAYPRNYVSWYLPGYRPDLQVEFSVVREISSSLEFLPTGPNGPFVSLTHLGDRIVGMIANFPQDPDDERIYRFYYKILEDGVPLRWAHPVQEAPDPNNGGGVDVPAKPPKAVNEEQGLPTTS